VISFVIAKCVFEFGPTLETPSEIAVMVDSDTKRAVK